MSAMPSFATTGRLGIIAGLGLLAAAGCDSTNAFEVRIPAGAEMHLSAGPFSINDGQLDTLNVTVVDNEGNPLNAEIGWSSSNNSIVSVSAEGVIKGEHAGSATVTAAVGELTASATVTVRPVPIALQYVSGANQAALASSPVPGELTVRLIDRHGSPVSSTPVDFSIQSGGGAATPATANTDAQGYARTTWTLGAAGDQRLTAVARKPVYVTSIPDSAVQFAAAITPPVVPPPVITSPGNVTDLTVVHAAGDSVVLRWTQVTDGAGSAAGYAIRTGSPTLTWSSASASERVVAGTTVGSLRTYTYRELGSGTHQFRLVSYRGTLNVSATFGALSNEVGATLQAPPPPPPPPVDTVVASVAASIASRTFTTAGETYRATATARTASGTVISGAAFTWSSSNAAAATVDNTGLIRAVAAGNSSVIVRNPGSGRADTIAVTVNIAAPPPPPPPGTGTPYFSDNFDSGSRTNANGFRWTGSNAISTTHAASGSHSMRFRYVANANGEDGMAEERFVLAPDAASAPTEVWIEFNWRVPENYQHRSQSTGATNNKFMTLWAENYSAANEAQFYLSLERRSNSETTLDIIAVHGDDPRYPSNAWFAGSTAFVGPADYGKWMNVRVHARLAVDGEVQVYKNGVLYNQMRNFNMVRANYNWDYFRNGYLMGWSNSGFTEQTDFYIDDFKIYRSNPGW